MSVLWILYCAFFLCAIRVGGDVSAVSASSFLQADPPVAPNASALMGSADGLSTVSVGNANSYLSLRYGSGPWFPGRSRGAFTMWMGSLFLLGPGGTMNDVWMSGDMGNTWRFVSQTSGSAFGPCSNGPSVQAFGQTIVWCGSDLQGNSNAGPPTRHH